MKKIILFLFLGGYLNGCCPEEGFPEFLEDAIAVAIKLREEIIIQAQQKRRTEKFNQLQRIAQDEKYYFSLLTTDIFHMVGEKYVGKEIIKQ